MKIVEGTSALLVGLKMPLPIYVPPASELRCRERNGRVFLLCGDRTISLSTPVAAKVGMALARNGHLALQSAEWVSFKVDRLELALLPEAAIQLGGIMLKKADRADDWQRQGRSA